MFKQQVATRKHDKNPLFCSLRQDLVTQRHKRFRNWSCCGIYKNVPLFLSTLYIYVCRFVAPKRIYFFVRSKHAILPLWKANFFPGKHNTENQLKIVCYIRLANHSHITTQILLCECKQSDTWVIVIIQFYRSKILLGHIE